MCIPVELFKLQAQAVADAIEEQKKLDASRPNKPMDSAISYGGAAGGGKKSLAKKVMKSRQNYLDVGRDVSAPVVQRRRDDSDDNFLIGAAVGGVAGAIVGSMLDDD